MSAWTDWFPDQTCPGCREQHPGQPCPTQDPLPDQEALFQ